VVHKWCGVCDGASLPKGDRAAVYMLRTFGGEGA
jgi:hypothetical protein